MSTVEVIRADLASGNYKNTTHSNQRRVQRNVSRDDVMVCAIDAEIMIQTDGTFLVLGLDSKNDDLTIVCGYDNGTLIITAY